MIEEHGNTTNEIILIKRAVLCAISISIFAFLVCCSSWNADSLFPHSFSICFSTGLVSVFARTFERKFMFLVCNGILAILAKSSPDLAGSSSAMSPNPELDILASVAMEGESVINENVILLNSTDIARVEDEGPAQNLEEEPDLQKISIRASRAGTKEDEIQSKGVIADYEDFNMETEPEEEDDENLSNRDMIDESGQLAVEDVTTEELNRRIDEFIRKMKAEIQIEAQSQLIYV